MQALRGGGLGGGGRRLCRSLCWSRHRSRRRLGGPVRRKPQHAHRRTSCSHPPARHDSNYSTTYLLSYFRTSADVSVPRLPGFPRPPAIRPLGSVPQFYEVSQRIRRDMRARALLLLPCYSCFSGLAGVVSPRPRASARLRRASAPLLQDVTRAARGDRGTADGQVERRAADPQPQPQPHPHSQPS